MSDLEKLHAAYKKVQIAKEAFEVFQAPITARVNNALPFWLKNKKNRKLYQILYSWPDPTHAIKVMDRKCLVTWSANLDEFTVTKKKIKL